MPSIILKFKTSSDFKITMNQRGKRFNENIMMNPLQAFMIR